MSSQALILTLAAMLLTAPPISRADDEKREPAAIEQAPAPKSDVQIAPAFNDAFEYMNELKTFNDFVNDVKKSLNEADQKTLADVAAKVNKHDPKFMSKLRLSYESGQAVIRYEGKVVTYKNIDFDNYQVSLDGKRVDLSPSIPLKDKIETVAAIINKKFSSTSLLSLAVPDAKAQGVATPWVLGLAAVGTLGYVMVRDLYYHDYLRDVHNQMVDAREACDRYAERKEKADSKYKWERVATGKTNRRGKAIYEWRRKKIDVNRSAEKIRDDEITALGPAPAEDDESGARGKYAKDVEEIKKRYEDEKKTRGNLPITDDMAKRSESIKHALCDGWGSIKIGEYHLQNFRLHADVSFKEQCNEATDLHTCIDSLRGKKVLSESGIKRLQALLDAVDINADYRRQHGLPGRAKEKYAQ